MRIIHKSCIILLLFCFGITIFFAQTKTQIIEQQNRIIDSLKDRIDFDRSQNLILNIQKDKALESVNSKFKLLESDYESLQNKISFLTDKASPIMSIEGSEYYIVYSQENLPVVLIGGQHWMLENLSVSTFRNGDTIHFAKTKEQWEEASKNKLAAWCYYGEDSLLHATYGKLYNWYAVNDPRGLAPEGWKIASQKDFSVLNNHVGMEGGKKLKSATYWLPYGCTACRKIDIGEKKCKICKGKLNNSSQPFLGTGNNRSGFNALPGGSRFATGEFDAWSKEEQLGRLGYWWCTDERDDTSANYVELKNTSSAFDIYGAREKGTGMSVRCILLEKNK